MRAAWSHGQKRSRRIAAPRESDGPASAVLPLPTRSPRVYGQRVKPLLAPLPPVTRRGFCSGAVVLVCAPWAACADAGGESVTLTRPTTPARPTRVDGWPVPGCTTLPPSDFASLSALFDALVPGPGGAADAGAAWYLDQLLGAFTVDPPRIYAGGPYSGRHGGAASFEHFQRLTRVEALRWAIAIEGSRGLPEREFAGPVVGLVDRYTAGLAALNDAAQASAGSTFAALDAVARATLLFSADEAFVALAYGHAVEGTYGDPAYGANKDGIGWSTIDFEGDRQPRGYTAAQMSRPEDG